MTNLQCDQWQIDPDGTVKCLGQVSEVVGLFPPLTLTEANALIVAIVGLFVLVLKLRILRKLF